MSADLVRLGQQSAELIRKDALVRAATAAVETLQNVVITDDAQAQSVSALIAQARKGKAQAKKLMDTATLDWRVAVKAVEDEIKPLMKLCDEAIAAGNAANTRWLLEVQRRLEAERKRQRDEEEAARRRAEEEAAITGMDVVPEAPAMNADLELLGGSVSAYSGRPMVHAGTANTSLTKTLKVRLVDSRECDPTWLRLDEKAAKDEFRVALRKGNVEEPKLGDSVAWQGCEFYYEAGSVTR